MKQRFFWLSFSGLLSMVGFLGCGLNVDPESPPEDEPPPPPSGSPYANPPEFGPPTPAQGSSGSVRTENITPVGLVPTASEYEPSCPAVDAACDARPAICVSNDDCDDGLCVNASCRSFCNQDDECPDGEACALGLCRTSSNETWECFGADDCLDSDDCVSGACSRRCASDVHCADCDDGPVCSFGYCGP